ncbi:hypothetical protein VTO42DRAFT_7480 [Malbranchea cinnamomea]
MESSPLTLAHSHARNALAETRKSNPVAASEEHDLAAGEFASAAQSSVDPVALRTLRLLEQHHKQLAELLRFKHENSPAPAPPVSTPITMTPIPQVTQTTSSEPLPLTTSSTPSTAAVPSSEPLQQPPRLSTPGRPRHRDPTSIASSLATARGIRSRPSQGSPIAPTLSAQNAGAKMVGSPAKTKQASFPHTEVEGQKSRPTDPAVQSPIKAQTQETAPSDTGGSPMTGLRSLANEEAFQRFYSTFEGLISKFSAPLAFASLPLGTDTTHQRRISGQKSAADPKVDRQSALGDVSSRPQKAPDMSKLISSAALRAIKDKNGPYSSNNVAESFYVVPTSGGMISYAGILSRAEKEARRDRDRDRDSVEDNDDDFVDAREEPSSPEMFHSLMNEGKSSKAGQMDRSKGGKTMEELQLENTALRRLTDTLSKRLHMWEVNAQSSSMALHQSLRALQNRPIPSPTYQISPSASTAPDKAAPLPADLSMRVKELEEMLQRNEKELQRVQRENEKLKSVVGRYRERWEKLKEGARARREGDTGGAGKSPATPPGPEEVGAGSTV